MKRLPSRAWASLLALVAATAAMVQDKPPLNEVKKPSGSSGRWDDYKLLATVPGNEAFQSLEASR